MTPEFTPFPKMPRLSRECIITEKIDGTNASILIREITDPKEIDADTMDPMACVRMNNLLIYAGSRTRWITPDKDNHGFACWVCENDEEIIKLGPGHHFGEWWGRGIQRGYGIMDRRFSLFNVSRWALYGTEPQTIPTADPRIVKMQDILPPCCDLVPVLYRGPFCTAAVDRTLDFLSIHGSQAAPRFMNPEGIVIYHVAGNVGFKKTLERDGEPKGKQS